MGTQVPLDAEKLAAEGQVRALRHARDAVDRSTWLLAMLRKELAGGPGIRGLRRLELRCVLADLERRQTGLSAAYNNMMATPISHKTEALRAFVLAYDKFLDAVGAARLETREDSAFCQVSK